MLNGPGTCTLSDKISIIKHDKLIGAYGGLPSPTLMLSAPQPQVPCFLASVLVPDIHNHTPPPLLPSSPKPSTPVFHSHHHPSQASITNWVRDSEVAIRLHYMATICLRQTPKTRFIAQNILGSYRCRIKSRAMASSSSSFSSSASAEQGQPPRTGHLERTAQEPRDEVN
jgi:hypothetical protein